MRQCISNCIDKHFNNELLSLICTGNMDEMPHSSWLSSQRSANYRRRKLEKEDLFREPKKNALEVIDTEVVTEVTPLPSTSQGQILLPAQLQLPEDGNEWDDENSSVEPFESNRDRDLYSDSDESGTESDFEGSSDEDSSNVVSNVLSNAQNDKFVEDIRACVKSMTRAQTEQLLRVLHPHHPYLPLSRKTLFKTDLGLSRLIEPFGDDGSKFVYLGIGRFLKTYVNTSLHKNKTIYLQFNADGLPLFKSCSTEFWPILGNIYCRENVYKPFIVAVYVGVGKPTSVDKYLSQFVDELQDLVQNGILINNEVFKVQLMAFIADRPARAFLKCIKGHTGYKACERCTIRGEHSGKRMLYRHDNQIDIPRRNESFTEDKEHVLGRSPLLLLAFVNMVLHFLLDFMHLGCLGVMKKLLVDCWLAANNLGKLEKEDICSMSQRLINMSSNITMEFQRSTRSLADISKYRANEFRLFSSYVGPFVMKGLLDEDRYNHFLLLYVAFRILSTPKVCIDRNAEAKRYLEQFDDLNEKHYGSVCKVLNMHSLRHLSDDVMSMNVNVNEISAFPFENKLGKIKKLIRSGNKPLEHLTNDIEIDLHYEFSKPPQVEGDCILRSKKEKHGFQVKLIKYRQFYLSTNNPNNVVLLHDGRLVKIDSMVCETLATEKLLLNGERFTTLQSAFSYPVDSTTLDIFAVEPEKSQTEQFKLNDIKCKMVFIRVYELPSDLEDGQYESFAMPLLHTQ